MLFLPPYKPHQLHYLLEYFILTMGLISGISGSLMKAAIESMLIISTLPIVSYLQGIERKSDSMSAFEVRL